MTQWEEELDLLTAFLNQGLVFENEECKKRISIAITSLLIEHVALLHEHEELQNSIKQLQMEAFEAGRKGMVIKRARREQ